MIRTGRGNEAVMMLEGEQGVGQITEELLQQACNAVHIMVEVFGVSEVKGRVRRFCEYVSQGSLAVTKGSYPPVSNIDFNFWMWFIEPDWR